MVRLLPSSRDMRLSFADGAGGGQAAYRVVTSDDWRVICPCQKHRGMKGALRRAISGISPLTRRIGTVAFALPVAFGLAGSPAFVGRGESKSRPAPVVTASASQVERKARDEFSLITEEVKREFMPIDIETRHNRLERLREEFFRREVPYGSIIYREARRNNLPPELVAAVVEAESDFRASLVSGKNAQGLMQIIPSTGELMGATDLMNPADNVRVGTRYMSYLFRRFNGDQVRALAAYNAGEGNVERFGGIPPFPETLSYIERVAASRKALQQRIQIRAAGDDKELRSDLSVD